MLPGDCLMPEWMDIAGMSEDQPEKRIHMARYEYAASVLSGKRVLDCACGVGYGAAILSGTCEAVGVDLDPAAIELARTRYPKQCFQIGDVYSVGLENYDAFVSFETLEHLDRPEEVI